MTEPSDDETAQVAQLDDQEDKLYAIGVPRTMGEDDIDSMLAAFKRRFDHATVVIVTLPMEGSISIEELDLDDFFEGVDAEDF